MINSNFILKINFIHNFCCWFLYSIANYPSYNSQINPPPRFSDLMAATGVRPESISGTNNQDSKKGNSSPRIRPGQKLQREAFQINV